MPIQGDFRDEYRGEYNQMLLDKATGANGIMQEKYITISVVKKDVEEARAYFARVEMCIRDRIWRAAKPTAWSWIPFPGALPLSSIRTAVFP